VLWADLQNPVVGFNRGGELSHAEVQIGDAQVQRNGTRGQRQSLLVVGNCVLGFSVSKGNFGCPL